MDRNNFTSQGYKLGSQIREAYGKVTYSQTCHHKLIARLLKNNDRLKIAQIVLSAITTSGLEIVESSGPSGRIRLLHTTHDLIICKIFGGNFMLGT